MIDYVPIVADPGLSDVLNLFKKNLLLGLNCHHIGTIRTFDPATQLVSVNVNYQKTFFTLNQRTGNYDATLGVILHLLIALFIFWVMARTAALHSRSRLEQHARFYSTTETWTHGTKPGN